MKLLGIILASVGCALVGAAHGDVLMTDQQVKFYADAAGKSELAVEKAKTEAKVSATTYLQAAQMRCRQKLQTKPEYRAVADEVAAALKVLADSSSLPPQERAKAGATFNDANEALAKMEADAFSLDPDIQAANGILFDLNGDVPAQSPVAPPAPTAAPAVPMYRQPVAPPVLTPLTTAYPGNPMTPSPSVVPVAPPKPVVPRPPGKLTGLMIGQLIHDGWDRLMAKDYANAIIVFNQAGGADIRDSTLLTGRGICEYELGDYKPADKDLDRAYAIASAAGTLNVPKQLVIATAAAKVMNANPMRGVRLLEDLAKPAVKVRKFDEELQNDLGIALSHADAQARQMQLFREAIRYYLDTDKLMNDEKHDGTSRWGINWIAAGIAMQKWQAYSVAVANVDQSTVNYQRAGVARVHAYDNYLEVVGGLRLHTVAETNLRTGEYQQSMATESAAQQQMNQAIAQLRAVENPPFPDRIEHDWREPR